MYASQADLQAKTKALLDIFEAAESPIEKKLGISMVVFFPKVIVPTKETVWDGHVDKGGVLIRPQFEVPPYRADFMVTGRMKDNIVPIIVECDGHDYHERTKEQAAHDKRRDRYFTKKGFKVLRFTGSEIFADSLACCKEIAECLL